MEHVVCSCANSALLTSGKEVRFCLAGEGVGYLITMGALLPQLYMMGDNRFGQVGMLCVGRRNEHGPRGAHEGGLSSAALTMEKQWLHLPR